MPLSLSMMDMATLLPDRGPRVPASPPRTRFASRQATSSRQASKCTVPGAVRAWRTDACSRRKVRPMTSPGFGFGRSPFEEFDELMNRFFGGAGPASTSRRVQTVDIGSLLSERARELVAEARDIAAAEGGDELDARHLLAAATRHESTRRLMTEAGADPDRIRERLGAGAEGAQKSEPTTLTPA